MKSMIKYPQERWMFALILQFDPEARKVFKQLKKMGAINLRLDYQLNRNYKGDYDRNPDPGAWNATVPNYGSICVIRRDKEWSIHG